MNTRIGPQPEPEKPSEAPGLSAERPHDEFRKKIGKLHQALNESREQWAIHSQMIIDQLSKAESEIDRLRAALSVATKAVRCSLDAITKIQRSNGFRCCLNYNDIYPDKHEESCPMRMAMAALSEPAIAVEAARIKQLEDGNIFFVGGVNQDPLRHCAWGFFRDRERAIEAARNNETDINEAGYYPYALVTEAMPGLDHLPISMWWFEFNGQTYKDIEQPEWAKRYGWMGFPTAALKSPSGKPDFEGERVRALEEVAEAAREVVAYSASIEDCHYPVLAEKLAALDAAVKVSTEEIAR
jgi:hypothetical protein